MDKKFRYLYNPDQKDFYLDNGAKIFDSGINPSSGNIYWKFEDKDVKDLFKLWCELGKQKKNLVKNPETLVNRECISNCSNLNIKS